MNFVSSQARAKRSLLQPGGPLAGPFRRLVFLISSTLSTGIVLLLLSTLRAHAGMDIDSASIPVVAGRVLPILLAEEDTDSDLRITALDAPIRGTKQGDKEFSIPALGGQTYTVYGVQALSNLLQELALAKEAGQDTVFLAFNRVFEPPADRISRLIRERYWDGLTRTVDSAGLMHTVQDSKIAADQGPFHVFVPASDSFATAYFGSLARGFSAPGISVHPLPSSRPLAFVTDSARAHGILSLALQQRSDGTTTGVPFVVPGGRFNEMYGWDSYFIVLGLLADDRIGLAQGMADNMVYQIRHYGKILNANRTYYLSRSQPPFLTSMGLAVYRRLTPGPAARAWLAQLLAAAIAEYDSVWMGKFRLTETGLSRYFDESAGVPPEVEPGHFDPVFRRFAARYAMAPESLERAYREGSLKIPELDMFFLHDRAMRESGHDTGYRLLGRCANLVTVDLNSLLYRIEDDLARTIASEFGGVLALPDGRMTTAAEWRNRAETRKARMDSLLWNEHRGEYLDYDVVARRQVPYGSATGLYPLWAGCASDAQAARVVTRLLPLLEEPGGIASSDEQSRGPVTPDHPLRQWDYPFGWAPHPMLAWEGLRRYGFDMLAQRLAYRWLFTITVNAARFAGTVTEKYDVRMRSHQVFAEYGNV
ncbi:MAG: trehalase, partial [Bacteroidetes bacterium]|nr:trehalase [Bacteroidota bacterium]